MKFILIGMNGNERSLLLKDYQINKKNCLFSRNLKINNISEKENKYSVNKIPIILSKINMLNKSVVKI